VLYRYMGGEPRRRRDPVPPMAQTQLTVLPTRSIYQFEAAGIQLTLTFTTPALPDDLDLLSRPITYLTWDVRSVDGRAHHVQIYLDVSSTLAVNTPEQKVVWSRAVLGDVQALSVGSQDQAMLTRSGDNLRIDWGYLYLALPPEQDIASCIGMDIDIRTAFVERGVLPEHDDLSMPRMVKDRAPSPVLACLLDVGEVHAESVSRFVVLAYDDRYSIEYFERRLRPYWRRNGAEAANLLRDAVRDHAALQARCAAFDDQVMHDLKAIGGEGYANLAALAFRQCTAAHKLVADADGTPLYFSKENFSNGCIGTVDITYPSSPFFLYFNPQLLKAQLGFILDYAASPRWKFPFAPHDVGQYPLANGQVYGGGERNEIDQMPIEESGNMLLAVAALAQAEGNADFAKRHAPTLRKWADYLREYGLDPENQLCTDDFAGHLAHNVNLSLKAIVAIGAYASLCEQWGQADDAATYRQAAQSMAQQWMVNANDGDHYRLTFDRPNTWSQKYNFVWDTLLNLNLFPPEVARKEIAYYKTKQTRYGIPLDSRKTYTKLDWIVWTATMAEDHADFMAFIQPLTVWINEAPSRVPMNDWFETTDGRQMNFQARSVVGGIYLPLLKARGWR